MVMLLHLDVCPIGKIDTQHANKQFEHLLFELETSDASEKIRFILPAIPQKEP